MKFRLYHYWRSSCSWRVRWALHFKQIPCEFIPVNLLSDETENPEYLQKNPMGYVPTLEILPDGNVKDDVPVGFLTESVAIMEYLEEMFPLPHLLPQDPLQRARVRQLVETINAGTQPLQNLNVTQQHSSDPEEQKKWNCSWIRKGLHTYETWVNASCGKFSVGDQITLADLVLIPQCYNALRNQVQLNEFPCIDRIYRQAVETESCRKSAPENFEPAK